MSDVQLGMLAPDNADRDATHVAVVPMIAAVEMPPGTHCGLVSEGRVSPDVDKHKLIGIVDPFLKRNVRMGQRFFLCLYPRTVVGLRHHYIHPGLDGDTPATSKNWIERWAASEHIEYDQLMAHARKWVSTHDGKYSGEYWCDGGRFEGQSLPAEFWDHYDRVLSTNTPKVKRGSFFTCSC